MSCAFPVCFWAFQPYIIVFVWNFNVVLDENGWLQDYLRVLVTYHRFFSFCLYIIGFVWFVLSLVNKYYMKQFSLFAWTHVALLIVVTQSYLIIQNIFEGLIWYLIYDIFRELSLKYLLIDIFSWLDNNYWSTPIYVGYVTKFPKCRNFIWLQRQFVAPRWIYFTVSWSHWFRSQQGPF